MRILPAGDRALLVEFDDLAAALQGQRVLAAHALDGVIELVPGARTVLVRLGPGVGGLTRLEAGIVRALAAGGEVAARARDETGALSGAGASTGAGVSASDASDARAVRIPVAYDGEDLAAVAEAWGCSPEEVVRRHVATDWVCAFVGFAPGFPYLVPAGGTAGLPAVPRRATSRPRVPAGSVALAAEYCGVYPRESPGGWQLIGRTDAVLWDARRAAPALVTAGTRVRFEPVRATAAGADSTGTGGSATGGSGGAGGHGVGGSSRLSRDERTVSQESSQPAPEKSGVHLGTRGSTPEKTFAADGSGGDGSGGDGSGGDGSGSGPRDKRAGAAGARGTGLVRVLDPGALTLVQDSGRPGVAPLGVGTSGAFDRAAHRLANRLVGNAEHAAALEVLLGGAEFVLPAGAWVAVTGATGSVTLDGASVTPRTAMRSTRDGAVLRLGPASQGLRYSVAVRGGIGVDPELGSRSRDTLAELGRAPLAAGEDVALADEVAGEVPPVDLVITDALPGSPAEVAVRPGPRRDWFTDESWVRMLHEAWTVSARADRTGIRLEGPPLARTAEHVGRELASEGMLPGAVQVSPDGVPTILGPDHPVTGGYPVIAVITDDTRDRLAQLRPGDAVRLRLATGRP